MSDTIPTPKEVVDPDASTTSTPSADSGEGTPAPTVTDPGAEDPPAGDEPKTFDAEYVKQLRKEAAGYRDRAKRADEYGQRLHTALVKADGRLQDPTDLPYDAAHVDDADALTAAINALLEKKPHLANRRPVTPIPQGATSEDGSGFSFASRLRAGAGG